MSASAVIVMTDLNRKCINDGGPASRILLPDSPTLDQDIALDASSRRALQHWQARIGEIFTVCAPDQRQYRARLTALSDDSVRVLPFAEIRLTDSPVAIDLIQALPEKERFELVLQKVTEIGVSRIIPYTSSRSVSQAERDSGQKKSHRWPYVVQRAARQCRRAEIPELYPVLDFSRALALCATADLALLCYEGEGTIPLGRHLQGFTGRRVALMVGPEGGFSPAEVEQARLMGVLPIGLGARILRTESAAIIATGIIQYALGDLGSS